MTFLMLRLNTELFILPTVESRMVLLGRIIKLPSFREVNLLLIWN